MSDRRLMFTATIPDPVLMEETIRRFGGSAHTVAGYNPRWRVRSRAAAKFLRLLEPHWFDRGERARLLLDIHRHPIKSVVGRAALKKLQSLGTVYANRRPH